MFINKSYNIYCIFVTTIYSIVTSDIDCLNYNYFDVHGIWILLFNKVFRTIGYYERQLSDNFISSIIFLSMSGFFVELMDLCCFYIGWWNSEYVRLLTDNCIGHHKAQNVTVFKGFSDTQSKSQYRRTTNLLSLVIIVVVVHIFLCVLSVR